MTIKGTLSKRTGIYRTRTVELDGPDFVDEEAVEALNRSWNLDSLLEDSSTFAENILKEYGVQLVERSNWSTPEGFRFILAGDKWAMVPLIRPASVKIRNAPKQTTAAPV